MTSPRRALVWSFAERYLSLVISVGSTMVLARLLTPAQVGIYSLCAAGTAVAGILRDFGVSEYLIQEKDLTKEKIRAALGIALTVAWCIGLIVFLGRDAMASFYGEPEVAHVLAVLALNFMILPFASPSFALLNREMAFRKIFVVQIFGNAAQAVVSVTLAWKGFGTMSLAWGPIANVGVQTLLLTWLRPQGSLLMPGLRGARSVLAYGSMFVTSRTIETFTRNAHEFFIAKQFGFGSVGLFSRAFGLLELFYNNVAAAILRVATPSFAADHRAGLDLGATFARGTAIFTGIAWPFFGFLALMAKDIIRVLFGPQWDAAAPIASILALSMMPAYLYVLGPNLLAATGQVRRRLHISIRVSPIHLIGVFAASFVSLPAVAAVWALSNTATLWLYLVELRRTLKTPVVELLRPSLRSFAVAVPSIAAQLAAYGVCRQFEVHSLASVVCVLACGVVAWLLACRMFSHPLHDEIMRGWRHVKSARLAARERR